MNIFEIEQIVSSNPNSPLLVRLSSLYLTRGRTEEALKLCVKAIEIFPRYTTAYLILSRCYASNKNYESAINYIQRLLSLNVDATLPNLLLNNWQQIFSKTRKDQQPNQSTPQLDKNKNDVEESNVISSELPTIISPTLAEIYYKQGEYAEALKIYHALIVIKPEKKSYFEGKINLIQEKISMENKNHSN